MKNFEYAKYTHLHRVALRYLISTNEHLTDDERKELLFRAETHDMDKMVLYMFWDKKDASAYHRSHASHHNRQNPTDLDVLESIFDFECAGLTKPDKPLNAYDTVMKLKPELAPKFMPVLERLHMNASYNVCTPDALRYISKFKNDGEQDILDEIHTYLTTTSENIYTELGDKCCSFEQYENLFNGTL